MLLYYFICVDVPLLLVNCFSALCLTKTLDLETEDPCKFQASKVTSQYWELRKIVKTLDSQFVRVKTWIKVIALARS